MEEMATSIGVPATYRSRPETGRYWKPTRRPLRRASGEEEVMPGKETMPRWRGRVFGDFPTNRRRRRGRGGGCDAGEGDGTAGRCAGEVAQAAGGGRRRGREGRAAGRGAEGSEPSTGEGGTATGMAAGGHGRQPGMARPFRAIGGATQGGKRGKSKRNQWGLIPPIQFWNPMIKLHGFEGGKELGFTGEGGGQLGEEDDVLARGPHSRATHVRGRGAAQAGARRGLGSRPRRRGGRGGPGERGEGEGVGRGRREGSPREREREGKREGGGKDFGRGPGGEREDFGPDLAQREREGYF
uniref:BKRF1 encodes EBNA-1 protein-like n=1 Tax=Oryza sativa subsp. japonica TaxID=39947 RepID=Q6YWN8_ORYSJ|nr:BKRF1 encodes EBNA-1 protein-like [Oryza sativa Japonica Group]BAD13261.1 BKRF1 encodes EBNA-1 protein-like [Oryza sativa Japonica Group]